MRNISLSFAIILCFAFSCLAGPTNCPQHYLSGEAPEVVNSNLDKKVKEICYTEFAVLHSGVTRTPLTSVEYLTPRPAAPDRRDYFHPDPNLQPDERAELKDYDFKMYKLDRGHMAPSADMSTVKSQKECFTLANMVPQNPDSNRKIWRYIETAVREYVKSNGPVYIVTGPLFLDDNPISMHGRVLVPSHTFKAVYNPRAKLAGVYVAKNNGEQKYDVISVSRLEQHAGINVFPKLDSKTKNTILHLPIPSASPGRFALQDVSIAPEIQ